jgi:hypothetical protein
MEVARRPGLVVLLVLVMVLPPILGSSSVAGADQHGREEST